tara:strand:+ start:187 stop:990 length:804 start_codon:yes stop_codon:yes gene_type:complete
MQNRLNNKISYILGGLGLIGSAISKKFLNNGSKVIILDKSTKDFNNFIKKNEFKNKNIFFEKFDCTKLNNIEQSIIKIIKKNGCPNIFINASYPFTKNWNKNTFKDIKLKYYLDEITSQLNSSIWTSHVIAKFMSKNNIEGSIIQISSIYGKKAQDLNIYKGTKMNESFTYPVIKGGINIFTKQLASYYGNENIRCNNIIAGGIEGPVAGDQKKQSYKFKKNYIDKVLIKRLGSPIDISSAALFLSSDESSYITGTDIHVDGGWLAV